MCGGCRAAISAGTTQAPAVPVIDLATPTTFSTGLPGALVTVIRVPMSCTALASR